MCARVFSETGETEEPLPASYLDHQEDHLSLDGDVNFAKAPAHDDGADSIIVSLTENVADKSVDMELANALAADALAPAAKAPDDESAAEASEADMWITNCPADSPAVESTPENYRERDQSSADTEVGSGQDTPNGYCPHGDDSCNSNGGESNSRRAAVTMKLVKPLATNAWSSWAQIATPWLFHT